MLTGRTGGFHVLWDPWPQSSNRRLPRLSRLLGTHPRSSAGLTRAKFPKVFKTVDPRFMAVTPLELEGVLPDDFDSSEFKVVGNVHRQDQPHPCHLILAGRARTHSSKKWRNMMRFVSVGPLDHQLSRRHLFDF